ncbi:HNH endonuclease [Kribbella qitaiheensis]|uniref:HNH endonuclease n=1 Tax=Kribbella qitaiheensis TaxID=1544730 RepID=UPI00360EB4FB
MVLDIAADFALRHVIMARLAHLRDLSGGTVTREQLTNFEVNGERRRLIDASRGIWNPRDLNATLSIVSSPTGPYDDRQVDRGFFLYAYRAGSTDGDNRKLRQAIGLGAPLILLHKLEPGVFVPIFPVFAIAHDDSARQFMIALDESLRFIEHPQSLSGPVKRYAEQVTRRRLHQEVFRGSVIRAYQTQCAVCRLQHGELLDAAHIVPDSEEIGLPLVTNGLSLCKIHHAAYDQNLLGIRPDCVVQINKGLLEETDGPMLKYGLQQMHGTTISLPARKHERPSSHALEWRYEQFRAS